MEIEITTAKKKLTKAILQQLHYADTSEVLDGIPKEVLGYINLPTLKVILLTYGKEYRLIEIGEYKKTESGSNNLLFKGTYWKFVSKENRDEFLRLYTIMYNKAKQTHIII